MTPSQTLAPLNADRRSASEIESRPTLNHARTMLAMQKIPAKRVSVAMATYNGALFVGEQIRSILDQSIPVDEIIITDDCSSDETCAIIRGFDDPCIKLFINPAPLGVLKNFERAVSLCSGDFITLADQDDIWQRDKIEVLLEHIGDHALIYTDADIVNEHGKPLGRRLSERNACLGIESRTPTFITSLALGSFAWGATMMMPRRTAIAALPFQPNFRNHDWWLCVIAASVGSIRYVDCTTTRFRIHGANYSIQNELSMGKRLVSFFCIDRRARRQRLAEGQLICVQLVRYYLQSPDNEKQIEQILKYANNIFDNRNRVSNFVMTLRFSPYLYPNFSVWHRFGLAMSKLIGF